MQALPDAGTDQSPPAGNASSASAAMERWLGVMSRSDAEARSRTDAVLVQLREALATIGASTILRGDAAARRLLNALGRAETMDEFDIGFALLAARLATLTAERASGGGEVTSGTVRPPRRPARTLLKL